MSLTLTHAPVAAVKPGERAADGRSLKALDRAWLERPDNGTHPQVISLTAASRPAGRSRRKGLLARLYAAVCRSRMAKAEQQIASYRRLLDGPGKSTTVP